MKLFRIKENKSGQVRTTLCQEDVEFEDMKVLMGFELLTIDDSLGEEVYVFKHPFRVPKFNKFYASRIKSIKDPYFKELVDRLLYLNPNPDFFLVKKMTELILLRFSAIEMVESEVSMGHMVPHPLLKFAEVEAAIHLISTLDNSGYEPDNEDSLLFSRNSQISKENKISLRALYRAKRVKGLLEEAIHTVAEHLIEAQQQVKVTDTRIEDTKMVVTQKGPASVKTIRKYITPRTKRIIQEHNEVAPFATETTLEKFYTFLNMSEDASLSDICAELQVSRSTAAQFKKLKDDNRLLNLKPINDGTK